MLKWLALTLLFTLTACNLTNTAPTPIPTPNLPRVQFEAPTNNATVFEGVDLDIVVAAADETAGIARVEDLIDTQPHQEASPVEAGVVPGFTARMNWLAQSPGRHVISAIAYRLDGTRSEEAQIVIEVVAREET